MSYSRGRFGIEFDAGRRDRSGDGHLLRWSLVGVVVLAVVSVVSLRGCVQRVKMPDFTPPGPVERPGDQADVPTPTPTPRPTQHQDVPRPRPTVRTPPPPAPLTAAAQTAKRWLATAADRPALERTLLEKLFAAERATNAVLALDTIERLRQRPAMADLDEPLARRLGALNLQRLLSNRPTPWTATVTTRRGDTPYRIAREHGTTVAAVARLNRLAPDAKLPPGRTLRVLEFPRAALVVYRQTKRADLQLNGKFFKRYYVSIGAATKKVSVQVTRETGPRTRFKDMGLTFAPADLDELAMFLPPGASIAVTE